MQDRDTLIEQSYKQSWYLTDLKQTADKEYFILYIYFRANKNHLHQWYISLAVNFFLKVREVCPQSYFFTAGCR